jgi:DNA-binding Lrp family transcriptional regulator
MHPPESFSPIALDVSVFDMDSPYSPLEFSLLNDWQRNFPIVSRPFLEIAERLSASGLDADEDEVLRVLGKLVVRGAISRVGAVFAPRWVGASTLAALAAPPTRLDAIAEQISAHPEVNHNYQREHEYNLWFVVTAAGREALADVLNLIEQETSCKVLSMPLEHEFHIDLGFDLQAAGKHFSPIAEGALREPDPDEKRLIAALQGGLALTPRPFASLAQQADMDESDVLSRIAFWIVEALVKRFGVIVRHHELGYRANAMVVFDVPDTQVKEIGDRLARETGVTLCYRRRRCEPDWRYNLYCMVHGRNRDEVLPVVQRLSRLAGLEGMPLFSTRRFKQCGARYFHA